jgi:hypothetical protein
MLSRMSRRSVELGLPQDSSEVQDAKALLNRHAAGVGAVWQAVGGSG